MKKSTLMVGAACLGSLMAATSSYATLSGIWAGTDPSYTQIISVDPDLYVQGKLVAGSLSVSSITTSGSLSGASLSTTGNANVGGTLFANGGEIITGGETVNGLATFNNGAVVNGGSTLNGGTTLNGGATVNGLLTANNGENITGDFHTSSGGNGLSVTAANGTQVTGNAGISGNLAVAGNTTMGGNLAVAGATTLNTLQFSGDGPNGHVVNGIAGGGAGYNDSLLATKGYVDKNVAQLKRGIAMAAALETPTIEAGDNNAVKLSAAEFNGQAGVSFGYARRLWHHVTADVSAASDTDFREQVVRGGVNYSF